MYRKVDAKSILNKKKKRDAWFLDEYTLNPFLGCAFNCQYCYIRGSKYGVNMEETLAIKKNAVSLLDKALTLRARKKQYGIIALASATDPYLRVEETLGLTQQLLEVILKHRFPVLIITKSDLVCRDIALLREIDRNAIHATDLKEKLHHGAIISFSFSTLDENIARTLEPGAPDPIRRLAALKQMKDAGFFCGVNLMPLLPLINDAEQPLREMIAAFKAAGADYVLAGGLTLFGAEAADSRTLYFKFLERKFPHLLQEYTRLYSGADFPLGYYQHEIKHRVNRLCNALALSTKIVS